MAIQSTLTTTFLVAGGLVIGGAIAAPFVVQGATFGGTIQTLAAGGAEAAGNILSAGALGAETVHNAIT